MRDIGTVIQGLWDSDTRVLGQSYDDVPLKASMSNTTGVTFGRVGR